MLALAGVLALGGAVRPALAAGAGGAGAVASVSYSTWIVRRQSVLLRFALPIGEAQRLAGSAMPVLTVTKVGDYVLAHTDVRAAGQACPAIDQGYDLGKVDPVNVGPGLYGIEIVFRCPGAMSGLELHDHVLFGRVPSHVDFARIELRGRTAEQLYTAGRERLHVPAAGPMPNAAAGDYARLGLEHLFRSPLRLCFLLAAVLLVRRPRDFASLLAALAGGYVLALVAESTGRIAADLPLTAAFIGLLTGLLAVASVAERLERPRAAVVGWGALLLALAIAAWLAHAPGAALLLAGGALVSAGLLAMPLAAGRRPRLWPAAAGVFGFLDGFVLPSLLAPLHLSASAELPMLAGYLAGAWLAGAIVLGIAAAAALGLRRSGLSGVLHPAASELSAACLAGLGTFWLVAAAGSTRTPPKPSVQISIPQALETVNQVHQTGKSLLMRNYKLQGNTLCHPTPPDTC